jgi:RNA polymerase sigma factor (sigma-70 family)
MPLETPDPAAPDPTPGLLREWFERREPAALERLLAEHMVFLRRYADQRLSGGLRSKEEGDDVLQDAIVEFLRYDPPFVVDSAARFRGLLCRIVDGVLAGHHRYFQRIRRQIAKERPLPSGTSVVFGAPRAKGATPSSVASAHEREAAVRLAISTLDPLDQVICRMRLFEERDFGAIAATVEMKEDSVRVRSKRAMAKVAQKLAAAQRGDFDSFLA